MAQKKYIKREIEGLIAKLTKTFPAVALSGSRQTGKSTVLQHLFKKKYKYVTFDDPIVREQAISDPELFLENAGEPAIFDEIQYVPQLTSYIKIAIDKKRAKRGRFILTGSQQFTLIKNLGDSLAGRVALVDLFPFTINEKKKVNHLKKKLSSDLNCFVNACLVGSYPEISVNKKVNTESWYATYLRTYLERDVRSLYNIGSLRDFQLFMQLLASRCSQILNLSSISNEINVSVNTLKRWLSVLEASQIIHLLSPYYRNFGKRFIKSPKIYFTDVGLASYLVGIKNQEHLLQGPLAGALFENFCIQEILKIYINSGKRPRIYFFRSHKGLEIDLLIEREGLTLCPVEIKLSKTPKREMASNIESYIKLFPKLDITSGRIICLNSTEFFLTRNIKCQSINQFLKWLSKNL